MYKLLLQNTLNIWTSINDLMNMKIKVDFEIVYNCLSKLYGLRTFEDFVQTKRQI